MALTPPQAAEISSFKNYHGHTEKIALRGEEKTVTYRSGLFKVKSHQKKYFVIALKY